jgi:hypothetical protein
MDWEKSRNRAYSRRDADTDALIVIFAPVDVRQSAASVAAIREGIHAWPTKCPRSSSSISIR